MDMVFGGGGGGGGGSIKLLTMELHSSMFPVRVCNRYYANVDVEQKLKHAALYVGNGCSWRVC